MSRIFLRAFVLLASMPLLHAGITIHFEGTARSPEDVSKIVSIAKSFSESRSWKVVDVPHSHGTLERVIDEKNREYKGPVKGVTILPDPKCEPINLQFGDDLLLQDFVKTQFAGAETHIEVISLFDQLRPHFAKLKIVDESDYWETRDAKTLEQHISTVNALVDEMKGKNSSAKGPIFLPSGRIIDITE